MRTVSVVMATYNGEKYLREQLDSIIQQTYPIHEIIIQDDCSTDGTITIIEAYIKKYPYVKLFSNDHNVGFNQNFKNAAMRATGDLVAISDQDDIWFPKKIELQVAAIANYDICCSNYTRGKNLNSARDVDVKYNFERLLFFPRILGHTMLCKKDFIQDNKNWIDGIWYDMGLSYSASINNGITKVEKPLNWHRDHQEEASYSAPPKDAPKYHAYLFGFKKYRQIQKIENRQSLYSYLYHHTQNERFKLVHRLCELLLKKDFLSIFQLCLLCQRHRNIIYWKEIRGFAGWVRGFFIPFIHAEVLTVIYKEFPKYE